MNIKRTGQWVKLMTATLDETAITQIIRVSGQPSIRSLLISRGVC